MVQRDQFTKRFVLIGALCFSTLLPTGCGEQDGSPVRPGEDLAREEAITEEVPASKEAEEPEVNQSDEMELEKSDTDDPQSADP